jgi:hypothetical protein
MMESAYLPALAALAGSATYGLTRSRRHRSLAPSPNTARPGAHTKATTSREPPSSKYLKLAAMTVDLDVQNRLIKIAQHCRMLADAEERDAESKGLGRRSGASHKSG